ncbi:MAG: cupin domain-containing protein [Anaerolineae bacterium]|nr:cupin domain-containing protein [Anaerolineae bacterium]
MKTYQLLEGLQFRDEIPYAQPLLVNAEGRILRFTLQPGQAVKEHEAPHSPVYIIVVRGNGLFAGPDGQEERLGAGSLIVFDSGERHSLRADTDELVCIVILHEAPLAHKKSE